jgi:hypothetical protein
LERVPIEAAQGKGPWEGIEFLTVASQPNTAGMGRGLPAGMVVTEEHARELVRLAHAHGREVP